MTHAWGAWFTCAFGACLASQHSSTELASQRCSLSAGTLYNGNATRAYDVNTKLGITGLGVKVGVIDTGTFCAVRCVFAVARGAHVGRHTADSW